MEMKGPRATYVGLMRMFYEVENLGMVDEIAKLVCELHTETLSF